MVITFLKINLTLLDSDQKRRINNQRADRKEENIVYQKYDNKSKSFTRTGSNKNYQSVRPGLYSSHN